MSSEHIDHFNRMYEITVDSLQRMLNASTDTLGTLRRKQQAVETGDLHLTSSEEARLDRETVIAEKQLSALISHIYTTQSREVYEQLKENALRYATRGGLCGCCVLPYNLCDHVFTNISLYQKPKKIDINV